MSNPKKPTLAQLGTDLTRITAFEKAFAITLPFFLVAAYFYTAIRFNIWAAVPFLFALEFFTYGSVSHDLVHRNYGLPERLNRFLLSLIELLCFRSGHAYMKAHLHHHQRFPHDDDIEGNAAKLGWFRALLCGVLFQHRLFFWALTKDGRYRKTIVLEGALLYGGLILSIGLFREFPSIAVYALLIHVGGWIIPFMTSYVVHDPAGSSELRQTRLFRGKLASLLFFEHLYHLEHHLYPQVPHQNWPQLAKRLDPYFKKSKVKAHKIGI